MLIVIEGCLGAGKSTVAKGLAACRNSNLLLENFEANPFLQAFYENPIQNAIETEFAFLMLHFHQLKSQADTALSSELIADFHLGKDLLYAELNLKDIRAKQLFRDLYELCQEKIPRPALLIFLSATTELLLERIHARKRDFELGIDPGYLATVNAAYEQFYEQYPATKLRVAMDDWDFIRNESLYKTLASHVNRELKNT